MEGLIQLYTGDGKGKTTAAFGLAIRAAGRDFKVAIVQFLKTDVTGELFSIKEIPIGRQQRVHGVPSRGKNRRVTSRVSA